MRKFIMFITDVCVLFLIKLRWPRNKSLYDKVLLSYWKKEEDTSGLWNLTPSHPEMPALISSPYLTYYVNM